MANGKHKISLRWKLFGAILAIPLFILVSEIILRVIPVDTFFENRFFILNRALDYPEVFERDHRLFWRLRPDQTIKSKFFQGKTYHINSLGIRGPEVLPKSGKLRIVALGNSCTFGWGIPYDETYAARLQALIDGDPDLPEVEVIDCGIPGYSSFQGRRWLASDVYKLEPDMVLSMFGWNDQWAASDNISDENQEFPPQWILDIQNFVSRLRLYGLLRRLILSSTESSLEEKLDKVHPVYRVGLEEFYNNLEVIIHFSTNSGAIPVILTSPIPSLENYYPAGSKSNMHRVHEQYNYQARLAAENGRAILIDVAAKFNEYDDLFDDAAIDPIHFNARGHEVAAETIYDYLKNNPYLLVK